MYTDWGVLSLIIAGIVGFAVAIPAYIYHFRKKISDWIHGEKRKKEIASLKELIKEEVATIQEELSILWKRSDNDQKDIASLKELIKEKGKKKKKARKVGKNESRKRN